MTRARKYAFTWVTLVLFAGTMAGHWTFGWLAYKQEQREHDAQPVAREWVIEMLRDTLENWQSEFLQLAWQVAGLAMLLHVGSPQSKDSDERTEAKLDEILRAVDRDGERKIKAIDGKFEKQRR
jgi:hypothetical protein